VFQHTREGSFIRIADVADFEIMEGRQIRIWPAGGATQKDIEIFLLGPAWATLCHQRGTLPLHASAIVTGTGVTAFAGHSGAGKSTTAALMNSLGYAVIADDILPVSLNENLIPGAWPYLRRLKLHRDPITELAFTAIEAVSETRDKDKYFVYPKQAAEDKWRKLERLYLIENETADFQESIQQITGSEAVRVLLDNTYHFNFIRETRGFGDHLTLCSRLSSNIRIYRLRRSPLSGKGKGFGSLICEHLESAGR
jgi:hypothetical protein